MIWGAGTALGEVPPYAVALHAARAGEKNSDIEKMLSVRASLRLNRIVALSGRLRMRRSHSPPVDVKFRMVASPLRKTRC